MRYVYLALLRHSTINQANYTDPRITGGEGKEESVAYYNTTTHTTAHYRALLFMGIQYYVVIYVLIRSSLLKEMPVHLAA